MYKEHAYKLSFEFSYAMLGYRIKIAVLNEHVAVGDGNWSVECVQAGASGTGIKRGAIGHFAIAGEQSVTEDYSKLFAGNQDPFDFYPRTEHEIPLSFECFRLESPRPLPLHLREGRPQNIAVCRDDIRVQQFGTRAPSSLEGRLEAYPKGWLAAVHTAVSKRSSILQPLCHGFQQNSVPLSNLLGKNQESERTREEDEGFERGRARWLDQHMTLKLPRVGEMFTADASDRGIGAVLKQRNRVIKYIGQFFD
ncbi:hypothetical protein CLF_112152 [Clonorchis sinensis]|uniref:Uncharacterized protein n=1 Tax=Clonorchis sinensis TaxID=79923 RepID=G7YMB2_CLOSI|nr:hypothetical protein CLF_112152 [Clonorchis sinensis]